MPKILLKAENLVKGYAAPDGRRIVLNGISFSIYEGECLAICGESGCGKTTLGMILAMLSQLDSGKLTYRDADLLHLPRSVCSGIRPEIQLMFQNYTASLSPRMPVIQAVADAAKAISPKMPKQEAQQEAACLLEECGLSSQLHYQLPGKLSGGECQRVCLARALVIRPKLLILDEPTSALDKLTKEKILSLIRRMKETYRLTILLFTHDQDTVEQLADRRATLNNGILSDNFDR